jgi:hypothetical protein
MARAFDLGRRKPVRAARVILRAARVILMLVIPAQAGIQLFAEYAEAGFRLDQLRCFEAPRRNDELIRA